MLALGTVALAIVSLVALLVTHADTRGLIKQTRIASKQQHDDAFAAIGKADEANNLTRTTFIAGQRPWVLYDDARPTSPLVIGDDRLSLEFTLFVRNYGRSPAREVALIARMINFGFKNQIPYVERRQLCESERRFAKQINGRTLAPSDMASPLPNIVEFSVDEFREIVNSTPSKQLMPVIIGCIDYQSMFDTLHHQTPVEFQVYKVNRDKPSESLFTIESSPSSIPPEDLRFRKFPLSTDAPD